MLFFKPDMMAALLAGAGPLPQAGKSSVGLRLQAP